MTMSTLGFLCSILRFMHHTVASCWALGVSSMAGYSMSRSSLIRLSISTFLYGRKSNVQWLGPCSDLCIALLLLVELPASPVWLVTLCHGLHSSNSQLVGSELSWLAPPATWTLMTSKRHIWSVHWMMALLPINNRPMLQVHDLSCWLNTSVFKILFFDMW